MVAGQTEGAKAGGTSNSPAKFFLCVLVVPAHAAGGTRPVSVVVVVRGVGVWSQVRVWLACCCRSCHHLVVRQPVCWWSCDHDSLGCCVSGECAESVAGGGAAQHTSALHPAAGFQQPTLSCKRGGGHRRNALHYHVPLTRSAATCDEGLIVFRAQHVARGIIAPIGPQQQCWFCPACSLVQPCRVALLRAAAGGCCCMSRRQRVGACVLRRAVVGCHSG